MQKLYGSESARGRSGTWIFIRDSRQAVLHEICLNQHVSWQTRQPCKKSYHDSDNEAGDRKFSKPCALNRLGLVHDSDRRRSMFRERPFKFQNGSSLIKPLKCRTLSSVTKAALHSSDDFYPLNLTVFLWKLDLFSTTWFFQDTSDTAKHLRRANIVVPAESTH